MTEEHYKFLTAMLLEEISNLRGRLAAAQMQTADDTVVPEEPNPEDT